jgi:Lectin C-type domain
VERTVLSGPAARTAARDRGREGPRAPAAVITAAAIAAAAIAALAAPFAGCLRGTTFQCASDADCTGSPAGRCEPAGYCSFPDTSCASGSRFGDYSGPSAGKCVDGPDTSIDAPMANCAGYMPLTGVATHRYRAITTAGTWAAHRDTCIAEGGYLVEPNNAAELAAVNMLAGAVEIWVGISDLMTEGTFRTGRDAAATFLPWEAGQPDDAPQGGADCVRSSAAGTYADDRCNTDRRTVCECDL